MDITNSPHVVIFRPLIERMRARGHEVTVTAREFAQTIGLLERFGIEHVSVGAHGGGSSAGKARAMAGRSARRWCASPGASASTSPSPTAAPTSRWPPRLAGTPQVTMFDYEYATRRCTTGTAGWPPACWCPPRSPRSALARYGMRPPKLVRYPGLKEEYYLADHAIDDGRARRARASTPRA